VHFILKSAQYQYTYRILVRSLHPCAALFVPVTRQMGGRPRWRLRLT